MSVVQVHLCIDVSSEQGETPAEHDAGNPTPAGHHDQGASHVHHRFHGFLNETARRPTGITLLAVVVVISGLVHLLTSIVVIFGSQTTEFVATNYPNSGTRTVLWLGIFGVVIALAYLVVARGLLRGNRVARGLATVVTALSLASAILGLVFNTGNLRWSSLGSAILAGFVLYLLYSPKANAFFRSR